METQDLEVDMIQVMNIDFESVYLLHGSFGGRKLVTSLEKKMVVIGLDSNRNLIPLHSCSIFVVLLYG